MFVLVAGSHLGSIIRPGQEVDIRITNSQYHDVHCRVFRIIALLLRVSPRV